MCDNCEGTIIQQVKVVVGLGNLTIQNGLTLSNSVLEWGGPLVHNTDIIGGYQLNLGTNASRLTQTNLRTSNQILLDYTSGGNGITLSFSGSGAVLTNTLASPKGLDGGADYSANYTANTYIQKVYADAHLGTKLLSAIAATPTITQDHYYLQWDNTSARYTLVASGLTVPGGDTQVIFNDGGTVLGASNKFTFNKTTGTFTSGDIHILGTAGVAGASKSIQVQSSDTNIALSLLTKGTGNINLGVDIGGKIILGIAGNTDTDKIIGVTGTQSNIAIRIQPKGTGVLYVGDPAGAGVERIIQVDGSAADISGRFKAKGAGSIYLTPGSGGQVIIGDAAVADTDYYLQTIGSGANRNLRISSNGTGRVSVDGISKVIIPINDWDMTTATGTSFCNVPHGITTPFGRIMSVRAWIRDDGGTTPQRPLDWSNPSTGVSAGTLEIDGVNVVLRRTSGGDFDNSSYNSTSFNRGWVTIEYIL